MFRSIVARRRTEPETLATIRDRYEDTSYIIFKDIEKERDSIQREQAKSRKTHLQQGANEVAGSGNETAAQLPLKGDKVQSNVCVIS